jgi:hypothetical protein
MAKGKKKKASGKKRGGAQRAKFSAAAKHCWVELRAGRLPKRGMFSKCMKASLKKRS